MEDQAEIAINMAKKLHSKVHSGPIHSSVAGRTDHLPMHVKSGSYVIPADIISAMGEGNTMAGYKVAKDIFSPSNKSYVKTNDPYGAIGLPYGVTTPHKASGGSASSPASTSSTTAPAGNGHTDSYNANQRASAVYAQQDNQRNGTTIPGSLQSYLPGGSNGVGPSPITNAEQSNSKSGFWGVIGDVLSGQIGGYKNWGDMINGGGMYGSYAHPGENISGLGAIVNDLQTGGVKKLGWDAINGGGLGGASDNFSNSNQFGIIGNTLGVQPAGQDGSPLNLLQGVLGPRPQARPADLTSYVPRASGGASSSLIDHALHAAAGAARAAGGVGPPKRVQETEQNSVPIVAAGGEYVIPPEEVRHIGNGSLDDGHKILDHFVKKFRAKTIKTLSNLPGPKDD